MPLPIRTRHLVIRNWQEKDRELFHEINSDPEVMAFFPLRRDRAQSDAVMDRLAAMISATGRGFSALALAGTDEAIGFCGLADCHLPEIFPGPKVEIGWRLARRHWGKGHVTEAALALLEDGFMQQGLEEIIAFAVIGNRRSTAVMERIGMHRVPGGDFDHPAIPGTRPDLRRHSLHRITRTQWLRQSKEKT